MVPCKLNDLLGDIPVPKNMGPGLVANIVTDSLRVERESLVVALEGKRTNGHEQ